MAIERDVREAPTLNCSLGHAASKEGQDQLWRRVEANWDDDSVHQAYLSQCAGAASLARAAGHYRAYLADPGRKAVAESQLKRIAATAMAQLEVTRAVQRAKPPSRPYGKLLLIAFFLLGSALLFLLL